MAVEIRVPQAGESVTEGMVAEWLKEVGEWVERDEPVVVLETDKATLEVPAPASGVLVAIAKGKGEVVKVGEVLGTIDEKASREAAFGRKREAKQEVSEPQKGQERRQEPTEEKREEAYKGPWVMPSAARLLAEKGLEAREVEATGPGGRLLKEDVLRAIEERKGEAWEEGLKRDEIVETQVQTEGPKVLERREEVVPMTMLRRRIAEKLVAARREMALLTTFNEIDMSAVQAIRREKGEAFQKRYGVKLGIMSFFVKAAVDALKMFPVVNASVRGSDIVYHDYYDIGIAVGGGRGLVVPVLRDADRMSFAEIEKAIADFAKRAEEGRLDVSELQGGTFTISNGGVYGSLLSTPIVNPPQSAILGLHAIQERPVVRDGQIVIRPMMYVALTYDHRIIDGREAVSFLRRIKECIEWPAAMLIEV